MSFRLEIKILRKERAFERVVSLLGRRGYEVIGLSAELVEAGRVLWVCLTLQSERSPELLVRQLQKLREVVEIRAGRKGVSSTPR